MEKDKRVIAVENSRSLARVGVQLGLVGKILQEEKILLIPYRKGDLWGYSDCNKNIIIPCIFDDAEPFRGNVGAVYYDNSACLIDKNGRFIIQIPCNYAKETNWYYGRRETSISYQERIRHFSNNGIILSSSNGVKVIYKNGEDLITSSYSFIGTFRCGYANVEKNNKWGFINENGIETISCIYDNYYPFKEDLAGMQKGTKWGYIDKNGNEKVPFIYDYIQMFEDGFAQVRKKGKHGLINKNGYEVLTCIYDNIDSFKNGFARIKKNDKWGYIDNNGNEKIPCIYDFADDFEDEFAYVEINEKSYAIDRNGILMDWDEVYSVDESNKFYATSKNEKYGVTDDTKNLITPLIYDETKYFSENFTQVKRMGKWGFIDKSGNEYWED